MQQDYDTAIVAQIVAITTADCRKETACRYVEAAAEGAHMANLFCELPGRQRDEWVQTLLEEEGIRIERILSWGQATPDGEWYDQERAEWVLLAAGEAGLLLAGEGLPRRLVAGDWLYLPAHCRHRVVWTSPEQVTIWLAVHWQQLGRSDRPQS